MYISCESGFEICHSVSVVAGRTATGCRWWQFDRATRWQLHPVAASSGGSFIRLQLHPVAASSGCSFIRFIRLQLHPGAVSSGCSFIRWQLHPLHPVAVSSGCSFIRVWLCDVEKFCRVLAITNSLVYFVASGIHRMP